MKYLIAAVLTLCLTGPAIAFAVVVALQPIVTAMKGLV